MTHFICVTCGTQFAARYEPPASCPVCEDERQFVGWEGQQWTTLPALQESHHNIVKTVEPRLTGIGSTSRFAIGQRALLVQTDEGNLLWDCISLLDEETIAAVGELGGVRAIAISHPHFYSSMVEWSRAFDAPILLHAADREWVMRPHGAIEFWEGEQRPLWAGLTLIRAGGHFPGGTILHWPEGGDGRGAMLTGDILQVVSDRRYVSFMYSYPNMIPLPARAVRHIADVVEPYQFDRLYGAWWDLVVAEDAQNRVARSAARYIRAIEG